MVHKPKLLTVLHNKPFALLWSGQSISFFGIAIYYTCLPFLVFHARVGAIELGDLLSMSLAGISIIIVSLLGLTNKKIRELN
ncbi:hypothetical protein GMD78_05620 [Ornithinibacillus sp. L9]|uniref:Uncharacterized protein n=1 Tax=Ornithinibacillus caprae TaxID=2678566 RepID=A0A6N8FIT1_9BACI|nr:hypothetical protein [Ornithinibacillus caprae]MUK87877.1 hypothetical protein [Ornithinibacillus caprae]